MGIETTVLLAAVAAGAEVGKMGMEVAAAKAKEQAIDNQAKQAQLQYQQKNLSNLDTMEKVLDSQAAAMTTRGVAFTSPSFNAIQRATLNIGAKQGKNLQIEETLYKQNVKLEKQNVRNTLYAQLFGDVSSLAMKGASMMAGAPTGAAGAGAAGSLPQMGE